MGTLESSLALRKRHGRRPLVSPVFQPDLPGYFALTFSLMPVGSTSQRSVQELGFASIGLLTPLLRLYPFPVRQASVLPSASFRFRLAADTLAVRLTLPLAGCVEDLHLRVSAPCRAHQNKGRGPKSAPRDNTVQMPYYCRGLLVEVAVPLVSARITPD
jgi:hypothetical protein